MAGSCRTSVNFSLRLKVPRRGSARRLLSPFYVSPRDKIVSGASGVDLDPGFGAVGGGEPLEDMFNVDLRLKRRGRVPARCSKARRCRAAGGPACGAKHEYSLDGAARSPGPGVGDDAHRDRTARGRAAARNSATGAGAEFRRRTTSSPHSPGRIASPGARSSPGRPRRAGPRTAGRKPATSATAAAAARRRSGSAARAAVRRRGRRRRSMALEPGERPQRQRDAQRAGALPFCGRIWPRTSKRRASS